MSNPYVGEIRMFAGNFAPQGWLFCDGSLLSIAEYEVLFNLIGTTYGGDGQQTFALPNLSGRIPMHQGHNQSNTHVIGELGGTETVTLALTQMPAHSHVLNASPAPATAAGNVSGVLAATTGTQLYGGPGANSAMASGALSSVGGTQAHDNMPPFVALSFIISLFGIYPSQT